MSSMNVQQDSLLSPRVWLTAPHTIVRIPFGPPTNQILPGQVGQVASQKIPRAPRLTSQRHDKEHFFPLLTAPPNPTTTIMDLYPPLQAYPWHYFHSSPFLFPSYYSATPQNYVHWTETPDSHLFSADLPGVRKEEIRVEVEDSRYLVIRTECKDDSDDIEERERRSFMRKFRLPQMVDFDGISARFEDGVLTVTVPRMWARWTLRLDLAEMAMVDNRVARAG